MTYSLTRCVHVIFLPPSSCHHLLATIFLPPSSCPKSSANRASPKSMTLSKFLSYTPRAIAVATTLAAPASLRTLAASFIVAPVVITSSINRMRAPRTLCFFRTPNAPRRLRHLSVCVNRACFLANRRQYNKEEKGAFKRALMTSANKSGLC